MKFTFYGNESFGKFDFSLLRSLLLILLKLPTLFSVTRLFPFRFFHYFLQMYVLHQKYKLGCKVSTFHLHILLVHRSGCELSVVTPDRKALP